MNDLSRTAAMNLKKLANWSWRASISQLIRAYFSPNCNRTPAFAAWKQGVFDRLKQRVRGTAADPLLAWQPALTECPPQQTR